MTPRGAIAAGSEQSAAAGAEMFRRGGNAVDAAVAAAFATSAGDAAISSLGGGGAIIFRDGASGAAAVCDGFANAPGLRGRRQRGGEVAAAVPPLEFFDVEIDFGEGGTQQRFHVGRGAAAVPGLIPGLVAALGRWGSLPLAEVVAPAVRFLREGFALSGYQARCLEVLGPILRLAPHGRRVFCDGDGELLARGSRFSNVSLARTLERLGAEGLAAVYGAELGAALLEGFAEERGGWISGADLARYRVEFRAPLRHCYRGHTVLTNPAPALGGRFVLLTLELFERARVAAARPQSSERLRREVAVFRAVSEARAADPGVIDAPAAADRVWPRLRAILEGRAPAATQREPSAPGDTTHISAVDARGNAIGITLSHGEGCGRWLGESGIHMNNILGEEDLFPAGFHRFEPGARLPTMMAPAIVVDRDGAITVLGSGGANRIRTAMAQVVSALLDDGRDPAEAIAAGRVHFENGALTAELYALGGGEASLGEARRLAQETRCFAGPTLFFGGVHVARRDAHGTFSGAGDPRRGGVFRLA